MCTVKRMDRLNPGTGNCNNFLLWATDSVNQAKSGESILLVLFPGNLSGCLTLKIIYRVTLIFSTAMQLPETSFVSFRPPKMIFYPKILVVVGE